MKAFLFPGIDSLEILEERAGALALRQVRNRLSIAQDTLSSQLGMEVDLQNFVRSPDAVFNADLGLKIVASIAVQVGVFEAISKSCGVDDYIVGCSLGDLARNVCAGIASFEEVVVGGYRFGDALMKFDLGETWRCSALKSIRLEDLVNLLPEGVFVSVYQTPKHFLIAGPRHSTSQSIDVLNLNLRAAKLADIPLHSPLMISIEDEMRMTIESATIRSPHRRVYSTLMQKELFDQADCIDETSANIVRTVDWVRTLQTLIEKLGVDELVNVGPASTLLRFADRTPIEAPYKVTNGFLSALDQNTKEAS